MDCRLALASCLAVAALGACQGSSEPRTGAVTASGAAAAQPRLRPANYNALSRSRATLAPTRPGPARPDRDGPLESRVDSRLGVPTFLWNGRAEGADARRAAPRAKRSAEETARAWLRARAADYGLSTADVDGAVATPVRDDGRGPIVVRFRQQIRGVEVFRGQAAVALDRSGRLVAISGSLAPAADAPAQEAAAIDSRDAVALALADLTGEYFGAADLLPRAATVGAARFDLAPAVSTARGERFARPARARPVWFRLPGRLVPAVYVELSVQRLGAAGTLDYGYVLSAIDGSLLFRRALAQAASYNVFADAASPFAPFDGPQGVDATPHPTGLPDGFQAPIVPQQLVTLAAGPISTGDPWLPLGGTATTGNNVEAYADVSGNDGFDAIDVRGAMSEPDAFDYGYDWSQSPAFPSNRQASIAQLFFTVNFLHDWFYDAGFDEAAGNAQADNFGRGGAAGDPILAEVENPPSLNTYLMTTPADGESPRLETYFWSPNADRHLTVDSPASIQRTVAAEIATGFGAQSFSLSRELVRAADDLTASPPAFGCGTIWANAAAVAGKIALVDRDDTCSLVKKARNAQLNGAVGVVIRNVLPTAQQPFVGMTGTDASVTIPAQLIDQATGDAIVGELSVPTPVTVTMVRAAAHPLDAALDAAFVAHEWGHYLTNRLIGDASGLDTNGALGLAEGWSDFVALLLLVRPEDAAATAGTDFAGVYAVDSWVASGATPLGGGNEGYYFGLRRVPYSTDLAKDPLTFQHIADGNPLPAVPVAPGAGPANSDVHNAGEVWATMLWECYAALLRDTLGPTPRLTFAEAQGRMKRYLVAALKLTPVSPTLLEARDALLAAAYANDPRDVALFWAAFAKRGAGQGAVGPDRWSLDNVPVTESYVAPPDLRATTVGFGTVTSPCDDGDDVLDLDEAGTLVVTLENVGPAALVSTPATVSSTHPGLTFPSGTQVTVDATEPRGLTQVRIPVKLTAAGTAERIRLSLEFPPDYLAIPGPVQATFRVNFDELPTGATSDGFETSALAWTTDADPALSTVQGFQRVAITESDHQFHAPDLGAPSDLRLLSPLLEVGAEPLVIRFRHRHDFDAHLGESFDGGVIELSADAGATWSDVGGSAYTGAAITGDLNPLSGRLAFVGRNPSWPGYDVATVDLGTVWNGKSVRLRFRLGTDILASAQGWWIDDVAVSGLVNAPFPALLADRRLCSSGFPSADAGAPQTVNEGSAVTLHGTAAAGEGIVYAWVQTGVPTVVLTGADTPDPSFTAPLVSTSTILTFQLTVSYGALSGSATTTVTVTGGDQPPVASTAGSPTRAQERTLVTLDGSSSSDPEGSLLTYEWTQTAGPPVALADATSESPSFTAPDFAVTTDLTFQLIVNDGLRDSAPATVTVTVHPPPLPDPGGCGCGAGSIDPSILALFPLGLWLRRRRR